MAENERNFIFFETRERRKLKSVDNLTAVVNSEAKNIVRIEKPMDNY
jgi:hypothetical protein